MYSSVVLNTFIILCNHYCHPSPTLSSSCETETLYPLNNYSLFPPPPNAWKPPFCFLSLNRIFFWGWGGGCAVGLVGSQFPDQGLNPGHGRKSPNPTTRPPGNSHLNSIFLKTKLNI